MSASVVEVTRWVDVEWESKTEGTGMGARNMHEARVGMRIGH
jgi:hypothetical protein